VFEISSSSGDLRNAYRILAGKSEVKIHKLRVCLSDRASPLSGAEGWTSSCGALSPGKEAEWVLQAA
jgi:hypothetical protein